MALRVARMNTHCQLREGSESSAALVEQAARVELPRALAARLGPSLSRQADVLRVKTLDITMRIDVAVLRRGDFADQWADVLARSLHEALARASGEETGVLRYDTREDYIAAMAMSAVAGHLAPDWRFPDFPPGEKPRSIALLDILLGAGAVLAAVLERLQRARHLNAILALLDEVGLDRLLRAAAEQAPAAPIALSTFERIVDALAAAREPPNRGAAASRRQALTLWLELDRFVSPRVVWSILDLIGHMLRDPTALDPSSESGRRDLPDWCEDLRCAVAGDPKGRARRTLEQVRVVTPDAAQPGSNERWIWLDAAGLLLLADPLRRLGWWRRLRDAGFHPRVFEALIVGASMRLLRPAWTPGEVVDPAAALLAGITGEADAGGLGEIMRSTPPQILDRETADWLALTEGAANELAPRLAARICGFGAASRESIVRHFLRQRGRVLLTETLLRIVLEPSPWWVAAHISGVDEPVSALEWFGGRRVEFVLEGL